MFWGIFKTANLIFLINKIESKGVSTIFVNINFCCSSDVNFSGVTDKIFCQKMVSRVLTAKCRKILLPCALMEILWLSELKVWLCGHFFVVCLVLSSSVFLQTYFPVLMRMKILCFCFTGWSYSGNQHRKFKINVC